MSCTEYLKGVYWFLEPVPITTVLKHTGLSKHCYRLLAYYLRTMMFEEIQGLQSSLPLLGGPGKVVCIDETYFTKKKRSRGGFTGAVTIGHKTVVLGMLELDLETRTSTGNIRLIILPCAGTPSKALLKKHIEQHVLGGSLVFTDSLASYSFLKAAGYVHRSINHKKKEFKRQEVIFGKVIDVTTNSCEGFFGRLKVYVRPPSYGQARKVRPPPSFFVRERTRA